MILGVYGSGGAGKEVKEIAVQLQQWEEVIFIDDTVPPDIYKGIKRMPFEKFKDEYTPNDAEIVISLGEPAYKVMLRQRVEDAGYKLANVIHPTAWISPSAVMGRGITLRAGVVINADSVVEDNVTIMEYSGTGHDSIICENAQIAGGVNMGGHCRIGKNTYIAMGVMIKENMTIGDDVVIGMGSVVCRDIPDNVIAMGNPARAMKHKDDKKVF